MNFVTISRPPMARRFSTIVNFVGINSRRITHGLETMNISVSCYTMDHRKIEPASMEIVDANSIMLVYNTAKSVRCIISGDN